MHLWEAGVHLVLPPWHAVLFTSGSYASGVCIKGSGEGAGRAFRAGVKAGKMCVGREKV